MNKKEYITELFTKYDGNLDKILEHFSLWQCKWKLEKRVGDDLTVAPYEVIEGIDNQLVYGGASCLWQCLIGNGTATADQTLTYFSSSRAYLGAGDSSTAHSAGQTDLQAASNKTYKAVSSVTHTDAVTSGAASIVFVATFTTSDANYSWQEWGVFNGSSGSKRMLNRKVVDLGTKTSAVSWTFTVTLSLS